MSHRYSIRPDSIAARIMLLARAGRPAVAIAFTLCFAFIHSAYAQSQPTDPLIQPVIPVSLDATSGNITVGSTLYAGGNPGMNMVALMRSVSSPGVISAISNQTFTDPSSANQFLQNVVTGNPDAILILNAVGNYGFALSALAGNLHQFGAAHDIDAVSTAIPFVFIGNGGLKTGNAHQTGFSSRNTTGYFATDSNGKYTFIQPDYVTFHITTDGTIQIGSTKYTVAGSSGCHQGDGFHIVVVPRDSPESTPLYNNTYCTNSGIGLNALSFQHFASDLVGQGASYGGNTVDLTHNESWLVFIASSGHPIPPDWNFDTDGDPRVYPVAHNIAQLGGYFETMVYLTPTDTYSLVGAAPPPSYVKGARKRAKEVSSVYPDHPSGALQGVLARGLRGNWYSPLSADPSGIANLGFYDILAQAPVAFPEYPAGSAEFQAFQYIANALCGSYTCNPRNSYPNITNWLSTLNGLKDQQNDDCSDQKNAGIPFCIVQQQLRTELEYVADIAALYSNLTGLWQASGTNSILELLSTQNTIVASLPAPPAAPAPSLAGPIVNLFLGLASFLPEVGPAFGLADTLFNFGTSLTTDASGNQTIDLSSTVASLEQDAAKSFRAEATTTGTQFDFIYQDWGRIKTLGAALANAQRGSPWFWDPSATGQILTSMTPAIQQSYYQSLMAVIYAIGSYLPNDANVGKSPPAPGAWGALPLYQQPFNYFVWNTNIPGDGPNAWQPFNTFDHTGNGYVQYTFPTDSANPGTGLTRTNTLLADSTWLGMGSLTDQSNQPLYTAAPASILTTLFTPVSQGGLGVYRPAFFEAWPFPRVACNPSYVEQNVYGAGCDWASAAPASETLSEPITRIVIRPGRIVRNGTRLDVHLTIGNSGTTDFISIEVSDIALHTLTSAGQATLVEPALPIHISKLKPGTAAAITLTLDVPDSINKLELTENGTLDNGESSPYKFSLGQVIFPKKEK